MIHNHSQPAASDGGDAMDAAELAELYVAGALSPAEQTRMEARLAAGDESLRRELVRVRPVMEALLDAGEVAAPRHLRERIEATVAADVERESREDAWDDAGQESSGASSVSTRRAVVGGSDVDGSDAAGAGLLILRHAEGRWRPTGIRGVRYRTLSADRRANRRTMLLQMDPGTTLPDHDHAGLEEVYLVSGSLAVGTQVLGPGDYFRVPAGVQHDVVTSQEGCVCIIVSNYVPHSIRTWPGFVWAALRSLFSRSS